MNMIDSHHHLWDLKAVEYPWLNAKGVKRFFGDPTPIQRNYLLDEFRLDAQKNGFGSSVHIQVGAKDGLLKRSGCNLSVMLTLIGQWFRLFFVI